MVKAALQSAQSAAQLPSDLASTHNLIAGTLLGLVGNIGELDGDGKMQCQKTNKQKQTLKSSEEKCQKAKDTEHSSNTGIGHRQVARVSVSNDPALSLRSQLNP